MNRHLNGIAVPGLRWTVAVVVLWESLQFALSRSAMHHFAQIGLPQWIRPALGGAEIIAVLLFLVPAIWGVRQGLRVTRIKLGSAIVLGAIVTALMIVAWSKGGLWVLNWALLWPTWYMVATARIDGRWKRRV